MPHDSGELEVMDPAEEAERRFPVGLLVADDVGHDRIVGERAREGGVELRAAALEVVRHAAEDLGDGFLGQARG
jgi:hypothetical protein